MRVETLYKTNTPEKEKSECYELALGTVPGNNPRQYAFKQFHGCWDDASKKYIHELMQINTEQEALTIEEAEKFYEDARSNCFRNGFVHSFTPDYFGDKPYEYQLLSLAE
jgi:hypothetical protein